MRIIESKNCWLFHDDLSSRSCLRVQLDCFENLPSWLSMPMKHPSLDTLVGGFISVIAEVLSGSALIPSSSMMWPRNFGWLLLKTHFAGLQSLVMLFLVFAKCKGIGHLHVQTGFWHPFLEVLQCAWYSEWHFVETTIGIRFAEHLGSSELS